MPPRSDRRLPSETFSLQLSGGGAAVHKIDVSLAWLGGRLNDVIFVTRGKIGHGLDLMLQELGIQLSRAIQGRDPLEGG